VAERLKVSNQTIADGFASVTVMFADIVDFTRIAAHMAPDEVFAMLNRVFSAFDELAEKYALERIKTIGDAYMVAGGLNNESTNFSVAIADMAVAMRELLRRDFTVNDRNLEVRIGIGTGPVVAGVVGKKKFIYDVWGDTVNTASRMESHGVPRAIHVSDATFEATKDIFDFESRGTIAVKGKGDMQTYLLLRRKPESGERSAALPDEPPTAGSSTADS
jgi:class 3 adenylate cyclase